MRFHVFALERDLLYVILTTWIINYNEMHYLWMFGKYAKFVVEPDPGSSSSKNLARSKMRGTNL